MSVPTISQVALLLVSLAVMTGCQRRQETVSRSQSPQSDASDFTVNGVSVRHAPSVAGKSKEEPTHSATSKHATQPGRPSTVSKALAALMEGNQRFVQGESIHPHESADYRASLANEQHPFATVLACSDSRVTPVLVFDQGIGDLFVIRVAGNVIDEDVTGSIEYAVDHLGAKLLVILGHENCGAVTAAYHSFVAKDLKEREPHEIESLLMRIEPALRQIDRSKSAEEQIAEGVEANVRNVVEVLLRVPDVHDAQDKGRIKIIGAIYSVSTGTVRLLDM